MRKKFAFAVQAMLALTMILVACSTPAAPQTTPPVIKETVVVTQEVEVAPSEYSVTVLNPQGAIPIASELAPRLDTLDGKKVALWLSATSDETYAGKGAPFYDELAKLLKGKFANIEIIPYTELPMKYSPADEVIAAITAQEPDAVVVGFGG